MLSRHSDPIAAISTAPGRGAVGIVRVSGSDLSGVIAGVCRRALKPREATYLPMLDAAGAPIDHGIAIHFPAPHSYTGEDVLELQAHGGPVVLQLLLGRCLELGATIGLRPAQPGEFTQRAFLNDKIDLVQAEAIADLIDASTEMAARSASRSLSGAFSAEIQLLLGALTELRMLVEATLDFPEEEVNILRRADVQGRLAGLQDTLGQIRRKAKQGALLREGIKVVIAGQPNAGKSSLLNALAGAELAIVSAVAGTTRDKVQQTIQIEGVPVHVIDTAGLRDSSDEVEKLGIARAWTEIEDADAVLFVHDLARLGPAEVSSGAAAAWAAHRAAQADKQIAVKLAARLPSSVPVVDVWNKVDTVPTKPPAPIAIRSGRDVYVSARTGEGLDTLRRTLLELAGWRSVPEGIYIARARHLRALASVQYHLEAADVQLSSVTPPLDLLAEDLRLAQNALSEITGAFGADDLLGTIFSRFCIGK